ncbi:MAG: M16 family metallopeptidase, partial [Calditrichia bacterium]
LENGLTIIIVERPEIPKVSFRLGVNYGQKNDPAGIEGAAELLADLLKKGTVNKSYPEIAETVDFMGGNLEAAVSKDFFFVYGDFLKEFSEEGLQLFSDVVMNPLLPEDEVEKERRKLLSDIENEKSSPSFLAQRRADKVLFHPHPYSCYKSPQSLNRITRETLLQTHRQYFTPGNSVLVISGHITFAEAEETVSKYFDGWANGENQSVEFPRPKPHGGRKIYLVDRPGSEQSFILIGNILFDRRNPAFEVFQVMNQILGGGASGRLFMTLREKKGYTYGAYSNMSVFKESGAWQASAEVRTEVTGPALETFFEEFDLIRSRPVSVEELKNAKRYLIGVFPLKNETASSIASLVLMQKLYSLPDDYWNIYLKKIDRVTSQEVREIALKYMDKKDAAVVVVGDAVKIEKNLLRFGDVEVYDTDDKRIR